MPHLYDCTGDPTKAQVIDHNPANTDARIQRDVTQARQARAPAADISHGPEQNSDARQPKSAMLIMPKNSRCLAIPVFVIGANSGIRH
jgi:hypothetical protein